MAVSFSFKAERLSQLVACAAGAASEGRSTRRQAVTIRIVASLSVARDTVSIMRHKDDRPASFRSAQSPLLYTELGGAISQSHLAVSLPSAGHLVERIGSARPREGWVGR